MLELTLRFESSWSNSLAQSPGGPARFTSGSDLSKSIKGLQRPEAEHTPPEASRTTETGSGPLPYLRQLQAANPAMQYRVPESYDNTVKGVLARLVGEVRRLEMLEPEHLALRAFAHGQAHVQHTALYSQTTTLTSAVPNPIQSGGAGLIERDGLYQHSEAARYLFGFLGLNMAQLETHAFGILGGTSIPLSAEIWTPDSPSQLLHRLSTLQAEQDEAVKAAQKQAKNSGQTYASPYPNLLAALQKHLAQEAHDFAHKAQEKASGTDKAAATIDSQWWLAAALTIAKIKLLNPEEKQSFIDEGLLNSNGFLQGITMNGNVGEVTPKGLFQFASGRYQYSNRLPYSVELPMPVSDAKGKPIMAPAGVIKKDGTLRFTLQGQPQLEQELYDAIRAASVGPLHFGKKGIAWLEKLEIDA